MKIKMRKKFKAIYEQYREHDGKAFEVVRKIKPPEIDKEVGRMWEIKLSDGTVIQAWPEEVERDVVIS